MTTNTPFDEWLLLTRASKITVPSRHVSYVIPPMAASHYVECECADLNLSTRMFGSCWVASRLGFEIG